MKTIVSFLVFCSALSVAVADMPFLFAHDISVRIALKSRLSEYRQQFPRPISQPLPEYPMKWREEGVTGEATLRFTVTERGAITGVQAIKSSQKEFADASLAAVKKWTFLPALAADRKSPIAMELEYLILFERFDG
jgi:TonB family protein